MNAIPHLGLAQNLCSSIYLSEPSVIYLSTNASTDLSIYQWLYCQSIHLSVPLLIYLSVILLKSLSMPLSIYLSISNFSDLSIYQCLYWSSYLSFYSFLFQYLYQFIYQSVTLLIYLSTNTSTDLCAFTESSIYFSFIGLSKVLTMLFFWSISAFTELSFHQYLYWIIFSIIPLLIYLSIKSFTYLSMYWYLKVGAPSLYYIVNITQSKYIVNRAAGIGAVLINCFFFLMVYVYI